MRMRNSRSRAPVRKVPLVGEADASIERVPSLWREERGRKARETILCEGNTIILTYGAVTACGAPALIIATSIAAAVFYSHKEIIWLQVLNN